MTDWFGPCLLATFTLLLLEYIATMALWPTFIFSSGVHLMTRTLEVPALSVSEDEILETKTGIFSRVGPDLLLFRPKAFRSLFFAKGTIQQNDGVITLTARTSLMGAVWVGSAGAYFLWEFLTNQPSSTAAGFIGEMVILSCIVTISYRSEISRTSRILDEYKALALQQPPAKQRFRADDLKRRVEESGKCAAQAETR